VSATIALTKYGSILDAGLLSSKYPFLALTVATGILTEHPLLP